MNPGEHVRLSACIQITADEFDRVHHAIGDTIKLSVTPEYLQKIGLIDKIPDVDADMAVLLNRALDNVAFLPFGFLVDQWRWKVFSGEISPADYNSSWWQLRTKYQGIASPETRTEDDFDPGAKFHVVGNVPYARYFVSSILIFQFHRALCREIGYTGPLHRCSIYGNKEAGAKLRRMLEMGRSRPWPEALKALTGETNMDGTAMVEYFAPPQRMVGREKQARSEAHRNRPIINRWYFNGDVPAFLSRKVGIMTGMIRFVVVLISTILLSSSAFPSMPGAGNSSSKQTGASQFAATDVQGIPPGGLPPMDVPPAGGQTVFIGRYAIRLPQGSAAQPKQNGITEVQQRHKGHMITAEIRPLTNVAPVPSHEQLRTVMNRVNPDMKPIGEPVAIQKPAQLRGFAVGQFYQQVYPQSRTGMVSGLFVVHVAPEGHGLALDVFSPAGSNNQNLEAVNEYAGILMNSLRDSR